MKAEDLNPNIPPDELRKNAASYRARAEALRQIADGNDRDADMMDQEAARREETR